jgi:hypothetical protein
MIEEWKRIYDAHHSDLRPNRKTGKEVDRYFREKYPCQPLEHPEFRRMVALSIMENDFSKDKLPAGTFPDVQSYQTGNVLVGIDLSTGEFHVESEDIEDVIPVYDDLFVYRGLDADDLKNFFLVAEYVKLTRRN